MWQIEIGSNLWWTSIAVIVAYLIVKWWEYASRRKL